MTSKLAATPESPAAVISEKDLLAMPEEDYMNPAQLAFFRALLFRLKSELQANADATGVNLKATVPEADPNDRASQEEEHALELRVRDRERKLHQKIDEAIRRIDRGEYGWCEETGDPIGLSRLIARPTATLSLEAQERREQRQKMQGG